MTARRTTNNEQRTTHIRNTKDFCEQKGFSIETEQISKKQYLVHVIDSERRIFKSGKRAGEIAITAATLENRLPKIYSDLQDLILERIFQ